MKKFISIFAIVCVLFTMFYSTSVFALEDYNIEDDLEYGWDIVWDGGRIDPPYKTVYIEGDVLDLTGLKGYRCSGDCHGTYCSESSYYVPMEGKELTVEDTEIDVVLRDTFVLSMTVSFSITVLPKSEFQFLNDEGMPVKSVKGGDTIKGKSISSLSMKKVSDSPKLYLVLYDKDGKIKDIRVSGEALESEENITLTTESLKVPENSDGCYVKMFLWSEKLSPLSDVSMFEIK